MPARTLINGVASDYVSVHDRGLHYGDGVFETIAVAGGQAQFLTEHLARLQTGAARLSIPIPDESLFRGDINDLLNNTDANRSIIKLILTRGQGLRGYRFNDEMIPTRICQRYEWPEHVNSWKTQGINTRLCSIMASINPKLAGIKHLNRLENILAGNELGEHYQEGFLLDHKGHVIEGTMSNLFAIIDQTLVTPDLTNSGIAGIIRQQVLQIASEQHIKFEVRQISKEQLLGASEVFICNSVLGICAVNAIDEVKLDSHQATGIINNALMTRMNTDA